MAFATLPFSLVLLTLSLLAFSLPEDELSAALSALRNHPNYSLFANALATSDLYFTLTSATSSFTLFAPTDPTVFSLDVSTTSADEYVSILRRHVVPRRLSLRSSAPSRLLPTLDPGHSIRIRIGSEFISVDGVDVVAPGIFYSRSVAVHGLGNYVVPRHQIPPPPIANLLENPNYPISDFPESLISPDGSVSRVTGSPESADVAAFHGLGNVVVPRHRTPSISDLPENSFSPVGSVSRVTGFPESADVAEFHRLGNIVVPRHRTPSPISDIPESSFSPASADVAAPVKSTVRLGHVITEPTLTCPRS